MGQAHFPTDTVTAGTEGPLALDPQRFRRLGPTNAPGSADPTGRLAAPGSGHTVANSSDPAIWEVSLQSP
jgi:hypothetical protein